MSPTQRALAHCRKLGWPAEKVEHRLGGGCFITRDLFQAFDVLALDTSAGCLGIQVTSGSNAASRVAKLLANGTVRLWLGKGLRAEVWSYAKQGQRGKAKRWRLRRVEIVLDASGQMVAKECAA
jgi:hypothetical protein